MSLLHIRDQLQKIEVPPDQTILQALQKNQIDLPAICGGRGTCGKCKIQVTQGDVAVSKQDDAFFSKEDIENGFRLACHAYITQDTEIVIHASKDSHFDVLTSYENQAVKQPDSFWFEPVPMNEMDKSVSMFINRLFPDCEIPLAVLQKLSCLVNDPVFSDSNQAFVFRDTLHILDVFPSEEPDVYGIAIDIGTTTIGFELIHLLTGQTVASYSQINRQRIFGADVISRIVAAESGHLSELHQSIQSDIVEGIQKLCPSDDMKTKIYKVAISGNTTMIHLLLHIPCQSLGRFPFRSTATSLFEFAFSELFSSNFLSCHVILLPAISTYVGADITAGLVFCDALNRGSTSLLIDVGTNGEMAICHNNKIICTSTAAGPAFEGGNISCGTGSIPGAISKVTLEDGLFLTETIGGLPPIGICGSGVMDIVACLIQGNYIEETGLLDEDYMDDGIRIADGIYFSQKDIREVQLAKSAIRAGIEILLQHAGIQYDDVDEVFLAGGFGSRMNLNSVVSIGLIPEPLSGKVKTIGNSSLGGCAEILLQKKSLDDAVHISQNALELNLSNDKSFNNMFVEYMYF